MIDMIRTWDLPACAENFWVLQSKDLYTGNVNLATGCDPETREVLWSLRERALNVLEDGITGTSAWPAINSLSPTVCEQIHGIKLQGVQTAQSKLFVAESMSDAVLDANG